MVMLVAPQAQDVHESHETGVGELMYMLHTHCACRPGLLKVCCRPDPARHPRSHTAFRAQRAPNSNKADICTGIVSAIWKGKRSEYKILTADTLCKSKPSAASAASAVGTCSNTKYYFSTHGADKRAQRVSTKAWQ